MAPAKKPPIEALVARLEQAAPLDGPAEAVARQVRSAVPKGPVKDALSGTWLGHALHPALTDVVIGAWLSAGFLDVAGGRDSRTAARRLTAVGILAALPTAASGLNDWADTTPADPGVRRVGAVHAVANVGALALHAASYMARRGGRRGRGAALGLGGLALMTGAAQLGGHLSFAQGVGVNQTTFDERPAEWTDAGPATAVDRPGSVTCVRAGRVDVAIVNDAGRLLGLQDRCNHRGGALHEGELRDGCLVCPLHASAFRLADGSVERGPAAYPQPSFEVRVQGERLQVRSRSPAGG
jgi:nitrite reductase/ring-hydroxylating ferredoxin subunit